MPYAILKQPLLVGDAIQEEKRKINTLVNCYCLKYMYTGNRECQHYFHTIPNRLLLIDSRGIWASLNDSI